MPAPMLIIKQRERVLPSVIIVMRSGIYQGTARRKESSKKGDSEEEIINPDLEIPALIVGGLAIGRKSAQVVRGMMKV